jgi:hypothetical protein
MVRRREPTRARTDDQHPPATSLCGRVELPASLERSVSEETLDAMDGDGAIKLGSVAGALAGVVADPPVDRRQRIVLHQETPGLLMLAGIDAGEPTLDILPRRASGIAWWEQIDVQRPFVPYRAGTRVSVQ